MAARKSRTQNRGVWLQMVSESDFACGFILKVLAIYTGRQYSLIADRATVLQFVIDTARFRASAEYRMKFTILRKASNY
jgi:hypothetical protein